MNGLVWRMDSRIFNKPTNSLLLVPAKQQQSPSIVRSMSSAPCRYRFLKSDDDGDDDEVLSQLCNRFASLNLEYNNDEMDIANTWSTADGMDIEIE